MHVVTLGAAGEAVRGSGHDKDSEPGEGNNAEGFDQEACNERSDVRTDNAAPEKRTTVTIVEETEDEGRIDCQHAGTLRADGATDPEEGSNAEESGPKSVFQKDREIDFSRSVFTIRIGKRGK